jgi:hypothetical protein
MSTENQKTNSIDVAKLRDRLRSMTDRQLRNFGNEARDFCNAARRLALEPSLEHVIDLEEVTAEWRRRHPKKTASNTK